MFYTKDGEKFSVDSLTQDEIDKGQLKEVEKSYKDGNKRSKESYIEVETKVISRVKHGKFFEWDGNGSLKKEEEYKNGDLVGSREIHQYHSNGKPYSETIKTNEDGYTTIAYHENGNKSDERHYSSKKRSYFSWGQNGNKTKEEYYIMTDRKKNYGWIKDGDCFGWNSLTGEVVWEEHYINGIPDGDWYEKVSDETTYEQHYRYGKKEGLFTTEDVVKNYKNDKLDGYYKSHKEYMTGEEGYYKNGRKDGVWKTSNSYGDVIETLLYVDGKVVNKS
jgi:antitoxin component YwqK of YwqJK toxin-antitoxin module